MSRFLLKAISAASVAGVLASGPAAFAASTAGTAPAAAASHLSAAQIGERDVAVCGKVAPATVERFAVHEDLHVLVMEQME